MGTFTTRRVYENAISLTGAGGGVWSPASLPGYLSSYKADGVMTNGSDVAPSNNDPIKQWNDVGGTQHLVAGNLGIGATGKYLSAGLNGKKTVLFDGTVNGFSRMYRSSFPMGTGTKAFFYGYVSVAAAAALFRSWGGYISGGETAVADAHSVSWMVSGNPGNAVFAGVYGATNSPAVWATLTPDTGTRAGFIVDGPSTEITLVVNGVKDIPVTFTPAAWITAGTLLLGGNYNDDAFVSPADFKISEWIVCNDVPTAPDLVAADSYLQRWD
jgi:hypothetical protein